MDKITSCLIGCENEDGSITFSCCRFSAEPEHQMPILRKHYTAREKVIDLVSEGKIVSLHKNVWDIEAYAYDYSLYEDPDTPIEQVEEPKIHTCNNVSEFLSKDLVSDEYKCVLCYDGFYELELKHRYYFDLSGKWNYKKV